MQADPYLTLMRRYCVDYTSVHDMSVIDEIMSPDYRITVSGRTMGLEDYKSAVTGAFRLFPTLNITVHEIVRSGDRLAMRFSEHGASPRYDGCAAVWRGISMYRWDSSVLLTCDVEQDFVGRDRQMEHCVPDPLEAEAVDVWSRAVDTPSNPDAEALVRRWLEAWVGREDRRQLQASGFRLVVDDSDLVGPDDLLLHEVELDVPDLFSAGRAVAARIVLRGTYGGGLHGVDAASIGRDCELPCMLLAHITDDTLLADARIIRDRWGLQRRLR